MALPLYMTIEGENQGEISSGALSEDSVGTSMQEGHEDEIMVQKLGIQIPRGTNAQTGQITSLPVMKPIEVTKMIDKASPLLFNALVTGEQLTIEINAFRIAPAGEEELYYVIELEDAVLVDIQTVVEDITDPNKQHCAPTETLFIRAAAINCIHDAAGTEGAYRFGSGAA